SEHLELGRLALTLGRILLGGRDLASLGAQVEQGGQDLVARYAVDHRVVDLREEGDATALEPVDEVELPQRPAAVERAGEDASDGAGELAVVAGRRDGAVADVEVEVEVGVLDPERV